MQPFNMKRLLRDKKALLTRLEMIFALDNPRRDLTGVMRPQAPPPPKGPPKQS